MVAANRAENRRWGRSTRLRHGPLLKGARERKGMSAKQLCSLCGMSAAQLSDIERGIQTLSLARANQIAKALDQPAEEVIEIVSAVLQDKLEAAGFVGMRVTIGMRPNEAA